MYVSRTNVLESKTPTTGQEDLGINYYLVTHELYVAFEEDTEAI